MDNRGIDSDPGWINRQLQDLRRQIEALRSERRGSLAGRSASFIDLTTTGDVNVQPDTAIGGSVVIGHTTTANAANVHMDTSGRVYRSTSSRRYKTDEHPAVIDTAAVLALRPRIFRTLAEVDDEGDAAPTHVGFIAEEAADLGLAHWVGRDDNGEPESFAYSQWCVAQQAVIQAQQAQIEALRASVASLETRLTALEAALPTPTTPPTTT